MSLRLESVAKSIAARTLFREVDLHVRPDDRIGLVGPNGAGKTTLLRVIAGLEAADAGRVVVPREARVGYLRQEVAPEGDHSVRAEAGAAFAELEALEHELRELEARMASRSGDGGEVPEELAARYDRARTTFELGGGFERAARVERVLDGLGFENAMRDQPLRALSGGWRVRVELAKLLLQRPEVLLLDEPTNHLDLPSIEWFEQTLAEYPGAVILVSHDRTLLRRHVRRVLELESQRATLYEGSYDRYLEERALRREQLEARRRGQERHVAETERFIERFRYKASKARQVQSRVRALAKLERVEAPEAGPRRMRLRIPPPPRSGQAVVRLEAVHKRYGERPVYQGVDLLVERGDRVALAGPNGAGKSTLLRILAGALPVDSGERQLGHNVRAAWFAQHQLEALDPAHSVLEELQTLARIDDVPRLRGHLGAFLFSGDDVEKKVAVLSGGEKTRLALAKLLFQPANLLLLDEPTNHLDVAGCEVLEQVLREYPGTLVLVSHDRSLINALATRVVEVKAGQLRDFPGNYDAYLKKLKQEEAQASAEAAGLSAGAGEPAQGGKPRRVARAAERERRRERTRLERRLSTLEGRILEHESALEALGWRLADPEVLRDGERVRAIEAERSEARDTIAALYRDWEGLAAEIEACDED